MDTIKNDNLTEFIQIRVNKKEKQYIQLMAKKYSKHGVSGLIMRLLYNELSRISQIDEELNEVRISLMRV